VRLIKKPNTIMAKMGVSARKIMAAY